MQLGVVLPTFSPTADAALAAAVELDRAGIDGAFVYDHLWPIGHPGRPAILPFPLLGALTSLDIDMILGTLVARVDLVPIPRLIMQLSTVASLASGRFIAGIGTGDRKGAPEYEAYGVEQRRAGERRAMLEEVAHELVVAGIPIWVGAGSPETNAIAHRLGVTLNFWNASPEEVARAHQSGPVSWGGNLPNDPVAATRLVDGLAGAGARWAVFSWPGSAVPIVEAATLAGVMSQ